MEVDNFADSEKKEGRRIDSGKRQILDSIPKPSDAEGVKSMQLDFKCDRSSRFEIKPSTSNASGINYFCKLPRWLYDDSIPQFGPKKFQGKGLSSTITRLSDNDGNSSGSDYSLKKSVLGSFSEPISVDEAIDDKKFNLPSRFQEDVEMQQTSSEPITSKENILGNRFKSFTEVNKTTFSSECLDDIEMEGISEDSILNEDNVFKNYSESFPQVNKAPSPMEIEMPQNSINMIPTKDNALKSRLESVSQANKVFSSSDFLDGFGIQKTSSKPISSTGNVLEKSIPEVSKAISLRVCSYDIGVENQSTKQLLPNNAEIKEKALRNHSGCSYEGGIANFNTECKKNAIHEEKSAIADEVKLDNEKRGVKRKRSGTNQGNNNKANIIQNVVRPHEEEDKTVRRSERIRNYALRPLILDRPRRNNDVFKF